MITNVFHLLVIFLKDNFIMLKFLQNRPEDRTPTRSPIKYRPEMRFGNSFQSPTQFQTPHTIFHPNTYVNPFLKFEPNRKRCLSEHQSSVQPTWTHKVNLSQIEEQKVVGSDEKQIPNTRYAELFRKEFCSDPRRFRITRGQFTNFIEKHNHYRSLGPLQGIQRTNHRIQQRQQSVWTKPPSKREEMTKSLRYVSTLNATIKSSIGENSTLLAQKVRIRRNRQHIQNVFKQGLEKRKKDNTSIKFQLPRSRIQNQSYLLQTGDSTYNKQGRNQRNVGKSQQRKVFQNSLERSK